MEHRTRITAAFAAASLLLAAGPALAEKVYRWVDEDGNVHYTESLPPGHKDTGHDVLNEQGLVIDENQRLTPEVKVEKPSEEQQKAVEANELPRDSSGLPRPKPLYTEAEKQMRMDNFLMLRYESEQEIIDAMNVEIKQLNYDRELLKGSRASLEEAYRGQIRVAANQQRAGRAVSDDAANELEGLQLKLAENARSLGALDRREQDIRGEFQQQLERYRDLVEKYAEEGHGS
jgi:hypothetical protein